MIEPFTDDNERQAKKRGSNLTKRQRKIVDLADRGKTWDEIAATLHCSMGTISKVLHDPEVISQRIQSSRVRLLAKLGKAETAVDAGLEKGDAWLGARVLEKMGVLGGENEVAAGPSVIIVMDETIWGQRNPEAHEAVMRQIAVGALPSGHDAIPADHRENTEG